MCWLSRDKYGEMGQKRTHQAKWVARETFHEYMMLQCTSAHSLFLSLFVSFSHPNTQASLLVTFLSFFLAVYETLHLFMTIVFLS